MGEAVGIGLVEVLPGPPAQTAHGALVGLHVRAWLRGLLAMLGRIRGIERAREAIHLDHRASLVGLLPPLGHEPSLAAERLTRPARLCESRLSPGLLIPGKGSLPVSRSYTRPLRANEGEQAGDLLPWR